jgi:hypothetical protein
MIPDPAALGLIQVIVSVLAVVGGTVVASALLRRRISTRAARRWLGAFAVLAVVAWTRFGQLHSMFVRPPGAPESARVERHRPFQFHEFFHYFVGSKYFPALGYLGLYDCTALADAEIAARDGTAPKVVGYVRDLGDVRVDETADQAKRDCATGARARFSPERWQAFEDDLRQLQALVPDAWWPDVVGDKGLNPPPTWLVLGVAVANLIPVHAAWGPTYLFVTSIDVLLLGLTYLALARAFGRSAAALAAITFGASFLASYGWLGGAVLRFTWIAALAGSIACMRRGRWVAAGVLLGWAVCDRVFPAAFAVGAAIPLAAHAARIRTDRERLARFALGFGATVAVVFALSVALFGLDAWRVFVERTARDAHVHNVLHVGLDKILTYRSWVPAQAFGGHEGLLRFRAWNERIDATWASERPLAWAVQIALLGAAAWASRRRAPHEAALLLGVTAMFVLASPASYYYVVLALVPVVLLRSRQLGALLAFQVFWLLTLLAPRVVADPIVQDLIVCVALAAFLCVWIAVWGRRDPPGAASPATS